MQNRQEILPTLQQNKRGTNQRYFVRSNFVPHLFCAEAPMPTHHPVMGTFLKHNTLQKEKQNNYEKEILHSTTVISDDGSLRNPDGFCT